MRIVEWAFEQDVPTSEKLVLVYLASQAGAEGVGLMNREQLSIATGYKKRFVQRLLKSLRDLQLLLDINKHWYRVGPLAPSLTEESAKLLAEEVGTLPAHASIMTIAEIAAAEGGELYDRDALIRDISQEMSDHMGDQLNNFLAKFDERLNRAAMFHVANEVDADPAPEPEPVDPALEHPLYSELLALGIDQTRAYELSKADLAMDDELENEAEPAMASVEVSEATYADTRGGRLQRVNDILRCGIHTPPLRAEQEAWNRLEDDENKHTQTGEVDAFELLYPAIVDAARANAGQVLIEEFIDPKRIARGEAPWDLELNPTDKDNPALMVEIAEMLTELEQAHDPRCEVQPRTKETGDDGVVREETVLGYHRRVTAKYNQMLNLQAMGVL